MIRIASALSVALIWSAPFVCADPPEASPTAPVSTPAPKPMYPVTTPAQPTKGKRVSYAKDILIDWSVPQVEITARVAQTELPIELLLCAEGTKEHESILVTGAQPKKIFEALGLIGASPGNPVSFDPATGKQTPAAGHALTIDVAYEQDGKTVRKGAHEMMVDSKNKKPIAPLNWIFCGSSTVDGKFTADSDGTIACVVDFSTALIGLVEPHTSSDADLWVLADKTRVPKKGTPCTVIIHSTVCTPKVPPTVENPTANKPTVKKPAAETDVINLTLTPEGFFQHGDEILDALSLDALIKERIKTNPEQKVTLTPMPVDAEGVKKMNLFTRLAGRAIVGSGINQKNITMTLLPEPPEAAPQDSTDAQSPTPTPEPAKKAASDPKATPVPAATPAPKSTPTPEPKKP